VPLARVLGVSPFHLSRVFSAHAGMSLTRYGTRVRASRALARIGDGERDLARLAADLGFADQAHLIRTAEAEFGRPPGALRALLDATPRAPTGRQCDTARSRARCRLPDSSRVTATDRDCQDVRLGPADGGPG
jgi:AraC-like DNA-binding protein